ncbi:MAG: dihydroorotate dehydrogenase [Bacteroidetes bacterium GWF2_38_335]|nr:MAG: dihydroorotate dehydrogenase [Bacteroidetes bacterium GWF2_38_335]OFY76920.1 MAG: dihydroorotate dehydrogenase [Bacteroidetes bacterium RIFOXYA12_FULL_38_20]HBS86769.1 dihydroorotate dehydrogenase [Bacteroidales bacterium]
MADLNLKTRYMGIELKNPIVVGSCNLVTDTDNLKKIEEAGAAAVVYKSLFEEQIQVESMQHDEEIEAHNEMHAEMTSMFPGIKHAGPEEHLLNLRKAKESIGIPVIASLNAVNKETWLEYAKKIEQTGVSAIEINLYNTPRDKDVSSSSIEKEQIELLVELKKSLKIPIAVKLSPFYANPLHVIAEMDKTGVDAFVLFNKLFQPELDIEKIQHVFPLNLSHPGDYNLSLRYAGLLHGNINANITANGGIYNGDEIVKLLLAGATNVQVVSAIYRHRYDVIKKMLFELESWMTRKGFSSIDEFRGKLSKANIKDPYAYKRSQYVDILMNSELYTKKYNQI